VENKGGKMWGKRIRELEDSVGKLQRQVKYLEEKPIGEWYGVIGPNVVVPISKVLNSYPGAYPGWCDDTGKSNTPPADSSRDAIIKDLYVRIEKLQRT
jgi:hypothetical protein